MLVLSLSRVSDVTGRGGKQSERPTNFSAFTPSPPLPSQVTESESEAELSLPTTRRAPTHCQATHWTSRFRGLREAGRRSLDHLTCLLLDDDDESVTAWPISNKRAPRCVFRSGARTPRGEGRAALRKRALFPCIRVNAARTGSVEGRIQVDCRRDRSGREGYDCTAQWSDLSRY